MTLYYNLLRLTDCAQRCLVELTVDSVAQSHDGSLHGVADAQGVAVLSLQVLAVHGELAGEDGQLLACLVTEPCHAPVQLRHRVPQLLPRVTQQFLGTTQITVPNILWSQPRYQLPRGQRNKLNCRIGVALVETNL